MAKKVSKESMKLAWVGTTKSKVSFEFNDAFNKAVEADKAAYPYVDGYTIRFLYRTDISADGWLQINDPIYIKLDHDKDLGWQTRRWRVEWDTPEHTVVLKAQVRIDIDTSKFGEWSLVAAKGLFGRDFEAMWDIANYDGKDEWEESDPLWGGQIQNAPQVPNVELLNDFRLLTYLEYTPGLEDLDATYMEFSVHTDKLDPFFSQVPYKNTKSKIFYNGNRATASAKINLLPGNTYYVKCRWLLYKSSTTEGSISDWSEWSEAIVTKPAPPDRVANLYADSESSAVLVCTTVKTATSYTIEWAEDKSYFDTGSSKVGSNTSPTNTIRAEGLASGKKYYFRVKATNEAGDSEWTFAANPIIVGKKPSPPTTWTYNTSVNVGENITFFWTHNSEDGSVQKAAQLYLDINGTTRTINVPVDTSLKEDKEYSYIFSTSSYSSGAIIKWKMRTKGILNEWSDWSIERQVRIYAVPTVALTHIGNFPGIIDEFPIRLRCQCGPSSLVPLSYNLIIRANQNYVGTSNIGEKVMISKGEEVYNKFVSMYEFSDDPYNFYINLYPKDVNLNNNIDYEIILQIAMDSGSSAIDTIETHTEFTEDGLLSLSLDYAVSPSTYSVLLKPVIYDLSDLPEEDPGDDYVPPLAENKIIDVYRRDFVSDEYILIEGDIENLGSTTIIDPHPSLKVTTYRIVSTDTETGNIKWNDTTLTFGNTFFPSIIIQWDEEVNVINDAYSVNGLYDAPISGNFLLLPFNIKTSESNDKDISHVEYIGRKRPVSYFGTQLGETASWTTEFDKTDDETIKMLRQLARWTDNVYVREPSGIGYWATVSVSFNNDYDSLVIPVTIDVTRVEGDRP